MTQTALYPLRFEPIYLYRPWGGRRLQNRLAAPLPGDGPIGEAWVLSDRDDHPSRVVEGALKGKTIGEVIRAAPEQLLGKVRGHFDRFPLLLKFLDVTTRISVQVHPSDAHTDLIPSGNTGKTEAWVVLEKGPEALVYAGLNPGTSCEVLRRAVAEEHVPEQLASFTPMLGDAVLVQAGIVHSLRDVVVFEVQENSDVTFRLYDWNLVDSATGRRRPLQVEQAMACIDFKQGEIQPVIPSVEETLPVLREKLIHCAHFEMTRISGRVPFHVGAVGMPRIVVGLAGNGWLEHVGNRYGFGKGDVLLIPAVIGACSCVPAGNASVLEISLPEVTSSAG